MKLAAEKEDMWVKRLIKADPHDVAENARLRAKIFAYQRLQDFLNSWDKWVVLREEFNKPVPADPQNCQHHIPVERQEAAVGDYIKGTCCKCDQRVMVRREDNGKE